MPISIQWDNSSETVVRYEFSGKWDWPEYHAAIARAFELVKDKPYVVNMILDFSQGDLLPSNALSHIGSTAKTPPRDYDYCVIVSRSGFIAAIVSIFRKLYSKIGDKLVVFSTIEEARKFLAKLYQEQNPAKPVAL